MISTVLYSRSFKCSSVSSNMLLIPSSVFFISVILFFSSDWFFFFYFLYLFIYLFFWLCRVLVAAWGIFIETWGIFCCGAPSLLQCSDFSLVVVCGFSLSSCGAWAPGHVGSVVCSMLALSLSCASSVVVGHGLSCPMACGILVTRPGIKPVSPALEGGFFPTGTPGKSLTGSFLYFLVPC